MLPVLAVLTLFAAVIVGKLVDLQVLSPDRYRQMSAEQRIVEQALPAERGSILDRAGVPLAVSVPQRSVFIDPQLVGDASGTAASLASVVGVDPVTIESRIGAGGRFAYVARHVPDEVADQVAAMALPGVGLVEEPKRFLPNGSSGRSVVGMTDIDGNGLSGLEAQYAELLTGEPGSLTVERSPDGRTIPVGDREVVPAVAGDDLVLSIDRSLQFEAERILSAQVEATGAKGGVALVMHPATGEIYAMANVRRDPEAGVVPDVNNAAVTTSYEPGSVMKMITASAAVEEGVVTPSTSFEVPYSMTLGDYEFTEHTPLGTRQMVLPQILSQSSNTGTIKVAQLLGGPRLNDYLQSFGLGERTAVNFPNEQAGFVHEYEDWTDSSIGSIPIGQGIAVTPLQMLTAFNVIANGGEYVAPRLVLESVAADGTRTATPAGERRRVVSVDTADTMNMMLRGVVAVGTGKRASVPGFTVAGKTGTAAKPLDNGTYEDAAGNMYYRATFVGFLPAGDPSLSILVMVDEPVGDIYGGSVAAPVFAGIADSAIRILGITPPVTDRAARFLDALPPEAEGLPGLNGSATPRVTDAGGRPIDATRVRAQPVAAAVPQRPAVADGGGDSEDERAPR